MLVQHGAFDHRMIESIERDQQRGMYIVLEGNRRLAAIKILQNPSVMNDLEVRSAVKNRLEALSAQFTLKVIEPIDCFDIGERSAATSWLNQRHTGFNSGRGIVDWGGVAAARFRGRDPALQAYELVLAYGGLSDEEKSTVEDHFPITTLDRLLSTPAVRQKLGLEIADQKLKTDLPPNEALKALRKIVLDLANEIVNVSALKNKAQQIEYIAKLGKHLPDLKKRSGTFKPVDGIEAKDFDTGTTKKPRPKPKSPERKTLIPRDCYLTVSNPKIAEIVKELRRLPLGDYPHSVSVLFRVFLETSVDHFLTMCGISLTVKVPTKGGTQTKPKSLDAKVRETITELTKKSVPKKDLAGVEKGIDDKNSPLYIDTLNLYVHNRFYSPTERELKVAWNNAQLFFENIWK